MSNLSGESSGNSNVGSRTRYVTCIPKKCWCGVTIIANTSQSARNPGRRYYRCSYASSAKLSNDHHIFKWVDEALLDEIDRMSDCVERLEEQLRGFENNSMEQQKHELELMVRESEWRMKKLLIGFGVGVGLRVIITIRMVL